MIQLRGELGLADQPRPRLSIGRDLRRENLDRDHPQQPRILGQPHLSHPPAADQTQEAKRPQLLVLVRDTHQTSIRAADPRSGNPVQLSHFLHRGAVQIIGHTGGRLRRRMGDPRNAGAATLRCRSRLNDSGRPDLCIALPALPNTPSEALVSFVRQRLTSIDQIEIVLLLMADRSRSWTAPEVAAAVGTPQESAAMRLFLLASTGLIVFEAAAIPRYRYTGSDPETHALVTELAELYASNRDAVGALVGAPPDPLRSFSDAFKLKK